MKTIFQVLIFTLCVSIAGAQGDAENELKRIKAMSAALEGGGIAGLIDEAKEQSWKAPHIPSQWHVDHVSKAEQKPVDAAARDLGKRLADRLSELAPKMQQLPVGDLLSEQTESLLDLSDWCAATDGYGNVFLAQRSLDLAAVGVARLAANLDFPAQRIDNLLARMDPKWMSIEANQRVLNQDAGEEIFTALDRDEMERTYGSGQRLLAEQRNPGLFAERQKSPQQWRLVETPEVKANLGFFDGVEIGQVRPVTLVNLWDHNWHLGIITGLELQSIKKAKALADFRRALGEFPEKPVFTAEEISVRDREMADAAKRGIEIVPFEEAYSSPRAAAFAQAWDIYLAKTYGSRGKAPTRLQTLHASALQAYDEVQRGEFFDRDTANMKQYEALTKANP